MAKTVAKKQADAFEGILGQAQVRDLLRTSVISERVTHAYLFVGPAGSNKTQAAYALAQALLCPKGAKGPRGGICGACENCTRVRRKTHPDIHFYEPEGASGYLVEQIREIVNDVYLAPIQATKKVYILDRVDLLGRSAANAFLKTLEEPPEDVVLILLGRTRESVLPTIVSRCQVVPFRHIPPMEAAGIVSQNTGASLEQSRQAIEAAAGSITGAISFLKAPGNERVFYRTELLKLLAQADRGDDWWVLSTVRMLLEKSKAPVDEVRAKQDAELSENADFLARSAIRQIESRNKRKLSAKTTEYLKQTFAITSSWLRDIAMVCVGSPELIINTDVRPEIEAAAACADMVRIAQALATIDEAAKMLDYNVSPETCLDIVFFEVREVLHGSSGTHQPAL